MEKNFEYEWWTVSIRFPHGVITCQYKGKSKEHIIKQINREIVCSNKPDNLARSFWDAKRKDQILEVYWDTLKFSRVRFH